MMRAPRESVSWRNSGSSSSTATSEFCGNTPIASGNANSSDAVIETICAGPRKAGRERTKSNDSNARISSGGSSNTGAGRAIRVSATCKCMSELSEHNDGNDHETDK